MPATTSWHLVRKRTRSGLILWLSGVARWLLWNHSSYLPCRPNCTWKTGSWPSVGFRHLLRQEEQLLLDVRADSQCEELPGGELTPCLLLLPDLGVGAASTVSSPQPGPSSEGLSTTWRHSSATTGTLETTRRSESPWICGRTAYLGAKCLTVYFYYKKD